MRRKTSTVPIFCSQPVFIIIAISYEHPCFFAVIVSFFHFEQTSLIICNKLLVNHYPLSGIPVIFALQLLHPASKTSEQCFRSSFSDVFDGYCQRTLHFCDIKNKILVTHLCCNSVNFVDF